MRLFHFFILLSAPFAMLAADEFKPTPYHEVQLGVPQGTLTQFTNWYSRVFTNTVRDWWIYVPAPNSATALRFQAGCNISILLM